MNFSKKNHEHYKKNRSFVSKKQHKNYLKLSLYLLLFVTAFTSCEEDLSFIEKQSNYKTVSIAEAKNFLISKQNNSPIEKSGDIELSYDAELLAHESIINSDALLTVVPASTKYENVYSRILLVSVNDSLKSVLFNMIPIGNNTSEVFSGTVSITNLNGKIKGAFKVENGLIVSQYVLKESNTKTVNIKNDCVEDLAWGIFCNQSLEEVIVRSMREFEFSDGFWGSNNINIGVTGGSTSESWNFGGSDNNNDRTTCSLGYVKDINDVCVPIQIINNLTGKAKCIFEKLQAQKGDLFRTTIGTFDNNAEYNVIFEHGTSQNCGNRAAVIACTDPIDLSNGNITIHWLDNGLGGLDMASAILHEGIHAEIYRYVDIHHNTAPDPNDRSRLWQLYAYYGAQNGRDTGTEVAQHSYMTEKYVTPIAQALRQLDGNRFDVSYYKPFAWQGLKQYGLNGYYENGNLVHLDDSEFRNKMQQVLNSTTFGNDCNN